MSYETLDGSALGNSDDVPASGVLTIPPKAEVGVVTVRCSGIRTASRPTRVADLHAARRLDHTQHRHGDDRRSGLRDGVDPIATLPLRDLAPIRPNPARGAVRLSYAVGRAGPLRVMILDVQGREIATLAEGRLEPGRYETRWSGIGDRGPVGAGLYFARCRAVWKPVMRAFVYTR
jgi:hypothetical protein